MSDKSLAEDVRKAGAALAQAMNAASEAGLDVECVMKPYVGYTRPNGLWGHKNYKAEISVRRTEVV